MLCYSVLGASSSFSAAMLTKTFSGRFKDGLKTGSGRSPDDLRQTSSGSTNQSTHQPIKSKCSTQVVNNSLTDCTAIWLVRRSLRLSTCAVRLRWMLHDRVHTLSCPTRHKGVPEEGVPMTKTRGNASG